MGDNPDLTLAVDALTSGINNLRTEVAQTRTYGQRNRHLIKLVGVSVAFDIALSAGLYLGFRRADDAAAKATQASSANVVNCLSGNESRRIQTDLWNTVLQFPPQPGETTEAKQQREAQTAKFKSYIAQAFAQKDCSKE